MPGSSPQSTTAVAVKLYVPDDADAEELDALTRKLHRELLELDVQDVTRVSGGEPPPGARAVDVQALGELLVTVTNSAAALASLVGAVRSWLSRGDSGERSVKLQLGGDALEVTGVSSARQDELIAAFLERHAAG